MVHTGRTGKKLPRSPPGRGTPRAAIMFSVNWYDPARGGSQYGRVIPGAVQDSVLMFRDLEGTSAHLS